MLLWAEKILMLHPKGSKRGFASLGQAGALPPARGARGCMWDAATLAGLQKEGTASQAAQR